jgi:uncharacterized protein (DUF362 family)
MSPINPNLVFPEKPFWSRREFLSSLLAALWLPFLPGCSRQNMKEEVFTAKVEGYSGDIKTVVLSALKELGLRSGGIKGKRVLLKPNLVEPHSGVDHINTHPLVVRGTIEAFYSWGASEVLVGEGPGHVRDTQYVLEESGYAEMLSLDRIPFKDFNYEQGPAVLNKGRKTSLRILSFPATLHQVDWIVSMAKMKTHHWAGVTLSMKNMFGVMPGIYYGWPKNVLHQEGIDKAIYDINRTLKSHFSIIDGIIGMEGDGPIMGPPKEVGVLVFGRNPCSVDATAARIMGMNPHKIPHLAMAGNRLGPIREKDILQRGEKIISVRKVFQLIEKIPAHRGIRL